MKGLRELRIGRIQREVHYNSHITIYYGRIPFYLHIALSQSINARVWREIKTNVHTVLHRRQPETRTACSK